jgi:transposase
MEEHIKELLGRYQYSEELKEEAAFRVLFGGEDIHEVAEILGVQSTYSINSWVLDYKKRINEGLINLPPMTDRQKQDLKALQLRNKELEKSLKDANLMILALNSMIDIAEKDLKIPIRKTE